MESEVMQTILPMQKEKKHIWPGYWSIGLAWKAVFPVIVELLRGILWLHILELIE